MIPNQKHGRTVTNPNSKHDSLSVGTKNISSFAVKLTGLTHPHRRQPVDFTELCPRQVNQFLATQFQQVCDNNVAIEITIRTM
jgi:hypothetical protein